jgi:hypothetical protein
MQSPAATLLVTLPGVLLRMCLCHTGAAQPAAGAVLVAAAIGTPHGPAATH